MAMSPPNDSLRGNAGHSSQPITGPRPAAVAPTIPSNRFQVPDAKMAQPGSAVEPGRGAIPVQPFQTNGLPNRVDINLPDYARPK